MEQAPTLTFSTTTPRPSAPPSPIPGSSSSTPTPSPGPTIATTETLPPASVDEQPSSPTETIRALPPPSSSAPLNDLAEKASAVVEKAKQHGLYAGNIEEEVGQVIGTLSSWGGSFWGGVKKQSASAFTTLKTDLDKTVSQAQADLKRLQTTSVEVVRKDPEQFRQEQLAEKAEKAAKSAQTSSFSETPSTDDKGKGKAREIDLTDPAPGNTTALPGLPPAASAFLDRITQSTTSLQASLQSTLASAKQNPALSNPTLLRDQLAENLRLSSAKENLTLSLKQAEKLAEEYVKKGEDWLHDAEKWVGDVVKVVPPEEGSTRHIWDGNDFYSFSTSTSSSKSATKPGDNVLFDFGAQSATRNQASANMAGSRKEGLLRRLREDKELLLVDPEGEGETSERKEEFGKWVKERWEKEGKEGRAGEEGNVGAIRMGLVPEHLTDEQFWQRYLFHKHNIEAEDEKRKKLLEATQQPQAADDFSWDDEEDPTSPITQATPPTPTPAGRGQTVATALPVPSTPVQAPPPNSVPTPGIASSNTGRNPSPLTVPVPPNASGISEAVPTSAASTGTGTGAGAGAAEKPKETSTNTSPRDSEESYDLVSDQKKDKQSEDEDSDWE